MGSTRRKELQSGKVSWEARVIIKGHPSLSKSFKKKGEATEWVVKQEAAIRGGGKVSRKAEKTTVEEALTEYLTAHEVPGEFKKQGRPVSTLPNSKLYAVESARHHLGEFTIDRLTTKRLNAFLKDLQATVIPQPDNKTKTHPLYDGDRQRTYSPGAARKQFYALKSAVEWHATEHGYSLGETFKGVDIPPAWSEPRTRRLNEGEEAALMEATNGMYKDPEGWRLLIGFALETAMRAGELLGMRWDEVKTAPSHLFIDIPPEREKTRIGRQVPLSKRALAIIKKLKARAKAGDPRVFCTSPSNSTVLGVGFRRISKRAGCVDLRFHDLRHEATARIFEQTDMQTLEIALMTGHTQMETLKRYANLRPSILAEKLDTKRKGLSEVEKRVLAMIAKLTGIKAA